MNPKKLLKAVRLPVLRAKDGSYMVGGDSDVYKVYRSFVSGEWACECKARRGCSHCIAAQMAAEKERKAS